jgi:hypothetical protein
MDDKPHLRAFLVGVVSLFDAFKLGLKYPFYVLVNTSLVYYLFGYNVGTKGRYVSQSIPRKALAEHG